MSDYLSRLIKRSHNSAEVIKPRLASLFEPPVQDGLYFGDEYRSDHPNVVPESDETGYNDLWPTRPSSDLHSGNRESNELHQQNHKPHVKSDAFQQTGQPEPQHLPDPQRLDLIRSVPKHDIARLSDQLTLQPSKQDQTAQLSSDNETYKTHDIPHRTGDMKSQPYAQDRDIKSNETKQSAPVLTQSNQQPSEQVQTSVLPQSNHQPSEQVQTSVLPQSNHQPSEQVQAPVLPQPNQQPPEQVQAPSSINNKNHDMPHRTDTKRSQLSAHHPEILPVAIKPAISQEKMKTTKQAEPTEPPVIKVTIGRIEVRAVTPPAPVPPQRIKQTSPVISLDEYLRLRNGGEL